MHKWHLLLLLILNILQPILSEHISIDGRQCCSHSSSDDERFHGRFDKPHSDTLRLNTLRRNRQDDHRYRLGDGEKDTRFSIGNELERRIFTTNDRSRNVVEQKLYRTVGDGRQNFGTDSIGKRQQIIHKDGLDRDLAFNARLPYENKEREIRTHFGSESPLEARRVFNERFTIQDTSNTRRQRTENWVSNLKNSRLDRVSENTRRSSRTRKIFERREIKENNGDLLRQNIRKRDLSSDSETDIRTDRLGFTINRRERSKRERDMNKSSDTHIAQAQSRFEDINDVRYSNDKIRDKKAGAAEENIYERNLKQIKDGHIISSLDTTHKTIEHNTNQRQSRSTSSNRRTDVRDERFNTRNTQTMLYGVRQSESNLYQYVRRPTRDETALRRVEPNRIIKDDQTNSRNREIYLRDKNLKSQADFRKQEENFDRSISVNRALRRKNTRRTTHYSTGRIQRLCVTNIRDDRTSRQNQERYISNNSERTNPTEYSRDHQTSETGTSKYAAHICEKRNTNIRADSADIREKERFVRINNNKVIVIQRDQRQQNIKVSKYISSSREERNTNVRDGRTVNRITETFARDNNEKVIPAKRNIRQDVRRVTDMNAARTRKGENLDIRNNLRDTVTIKINEDNTPKNIHREQASIRREERKHASIAVRIERTSAYNQQRNIHGRDERFEIKNVSVLSRFNSHDRNLNRNFRQEVKKVMGGQTSPRQKAVRTIVINNRLDERRNSLRNFERHDKDDSRIMIAFSERATPSGSRRISDVYYTRTGKENNHNMNRRDVSITADRKFARYLIDDTNNHRDSNVRNYRTKVLDTYYTNTNARNFQKFLRDTRENTDSTTYRSRNDNTKRITERIYEERYIDERNRQSQSDISRVINRQETPSREKLNTFFQRNSRYSRERILSTEHGIRESDIRRITNSAKPITIVSNTERESRAFREHRERHRDTRIMNEPVIEIPEEQTTIANERISFTDENERYLRDNPSERTISTRLELQRNTRMTTERIVRSRNVRNEREEERHRVRNAERHSRYNSRERAVSLERTSSSSRIVDLDVKQTQEIQRANVQKEHTRMSNNARYLRFAVRERSTPMEQNLHSSNERLQNKVTYRNIEKRDSEVFVRERTQERDIVEGIREQNARQITIKHFTRNDKEGESLREKRTQMRDISRRSQSHILFLIRSTTEPRISTFRRTEARNHRTEGNFLVRKYHKTTEHSADLYRKIENSIKNSNRNVRSHMDMERDNSRRQAESTHRRDTFVSTKASFVTATLPRNQFQPQTTLYLFYAIQVIYIFGVLINILRNKEKGSKTSSMSWLAPHMKVD